MILRRRFPAPEIEGMDRLILGDVVFVHGSIFFLKPLGSAAAVRFRMAQNEGLVVSDGDRWLWEIVTVMTTEQFKGVS